MKINALNKGVSNAYITQQTNTLLRNSKDLESIFAGKSDFKFDEIQHGLDAATGPAEKLRIIGYFNKRINSELMPKVLEMKNSMAEQGDSAANTSNPQPSTQDKQGSGLNPREINGDEILNFHALGNREFL